MIFSYLKAMRRRRMAARNYRILSSLGDDVLRDIGLERCTLRAFCDDGCTYATASAGPAASTLSVPSLRTLAIRDVRRSRARTGAGLAAAAR